MDPRERFAEIRSQMVLPVVVAPMFLVSGPDLVLAACRSGVIGSFPAPNARTIDVLVDWMERIRAGLDAARAQSPGTRIACWAQNLMVHSSYDRLAAELELGLREVTAEAGVPASFNRVGSMFTTFFTNKSVRDFASAKTSDTDLFGRYFRSMVKHGVNLAPSQFEAAFMSLAHTPTDIARTVEAARKSLKGL